MRKVLANIFYLIFLFTVQLFSQQFTPGSPEWLVDMFFGKNSLYKNENNYFLIFSKSSVKNKKFIKTFVFLSEYCSTYYSYDIFGISIKEKSKIIIENNALQKLIKI